ncbi:MAG TPA: SMC-Scp complex subunit ScpB [Acidobacteriaceae bacterium]|nr:SMC-Scp complex subunit ScpB [Acidobacteriaceae bacterium]
MSLKAKIEAVIYASDEPVTLAQLVGLLGHEAQAELDREADNQATLALDDAADNEPARTEDLAAEPTEDTSASAQTTEPDAANEPADNGTADEAANSDTPPEAAPEPDAAPNADAAAAARAEKARAARLRAYFRTVLDRLIADYASPDSDRGLEIREVAGGFRIATKPEYHDAVRGFVKSLKPPLKLTLQALETLAVVAYKQPVTAPEISEIRGVDSSGVLGSLIARKLITTAGRKQVIGRPILYKTTKDFLLKFGLKDVAELPSIEEFEKMAGQMAEQEEIEMEDVARPHDSPDETAVRKAEELEAERNEHSAQADGDSSPTDNLSAPEASADKASIDGRISSLPPDYSSDTEANPSAEEAEIQQSNSESQS